MSKPLSSDLRERIVSAYVRGEGTYVAIAKRFGIGEASVSRLLARFRATKKVDPDPHGGGQPARVPVEKYPELKALVAEQPDRSVEELRAIWQKRFKVRLSRSAMQRAVLKAGLRWKKNASNRRSSSDQTSSRSGMRTSRR